MGTLIIFYGLAAIIVCLSIGVIAVKNPITSVVLLIFDLFFIAGLYAMQGADFAAAIQIIVYAGAILVLFMFVIMLLNLEEHELQTIKLSKFKKVIITFSIIGFTVLSYRLYNNIPSIGTQYKLTGDNTYDVAITLFTQYLWPFELSSMLILLAIVASIIISKKIHLKKNEDFNG